MQNDANDSRTNGHESTEGVPPLLPCPFCGSGNIDYVGSPSKGYRVECKGCLAQAGWGDYGYQAQEKWNKRPAHPLDPIPSHPSDDVARNYGRGAYANGRARSENPYMSTQLRDAWFEGYDG